MTPALLTFTPFTAADVPLLTRWLQAPHVRAFWDDGERDEAAVAASYGLPDSEMTELLMRVDGQPVGFLQTVEVGPGGRKLSVRRPLAGAAARAAAAGHRPRRAQRAGTPGVRESGLRGCQRAGRGRGQPPPDPHPRAALTPALKKARLLWGEEDGPGCAENGRGAGSRVGAVVVKGAG